MSRDVLNLLLLLLAALDGGWVAVEPAAIEVESLPIAIQSSSGTEPFTSDRSLTDDDVVIGIGRPAPVRSLSQQVGPDV